MRVTKEPEVRKQEILDTALKLFGENGYEKTSITDIAKSNRCGTRSMLSLFSVQRGAV